MARKRRKSTRKRKSSAKKGWSSAKLASYKRAKRKLINEFNKK